MQAGERDYALLRPVGSDLRSGRLRRASAFVAGSSLLAALLVVALTASGGGGRLRPAALAEGSVSAELNDKFLEASAAGDAGKDFLSRLEDIWFVESNGGREDLAGDATQMAGNLVRNRSGIAMMRRARLELARRGEARRGERWGGRGGGGGARLRQSSTVMPSVKLTLSLLRLCS
jgi:hypothetical protein